VQALGQFANQAQGHLQIGDPVVNAANSMRSRKQFTRHVGDAITGCCDTISLRSCCCPGLQIALNGAMLEGTINAYPTFCCICCGGLPGSMNCCDLCFGGCCAPCCNEYYNRQRIRRHFDIQADPIEDVCKLMCCFCCTIAQDAHMLADNSTDLNVYATAGGHKQ